MGYLQCMCWSTVICNIFLLQTPHRPAATHKIFVLIRVSVVHSEIRRGVAPEDFLLTDSAFCKRYAKEIKGSHGPHAL